MVVGVDHPRHVRYQAKADRHSAPGIAYALAEECVILQTSFYPLFANPQHIYGRTLGVNWIYLLWRWLRKQAIASKK